MSNKRIWKYELEVTDSQEIELPRGEILTVQMQNGKPCLWALVDPDTIKEKLTIRTIGTGNPIEECLYKQDYIGTYQLGIGELVFHVFKN